MIITHFTQDNSEVILFIFTSRTQKPGPNKNSFYNTFTTYNADERHTGSGIAKPYTTVSLYTTTESPHHPHSVLAPPQSPYAITESLHHLRASTPLVTHSHIHTHTYTLHHPITIPY